MGFILSLWYVVLGPKLNSNKKLKKTCTVYIFYWDKKSVAFYLDLRYSHMYITVVKIYIYFFATIKINDLLNF